MVRRTQNVDQPGAEFQIWDAAADDLQKQFNETKRLIHVALCDNIDTRTVLDHIRDIVAACNIYIRDHSAAGTLNVLLLKRIATYITDILHVFGAINGPRGGIGFPIDSGNSGDVSFSIVIFARRARIQFSLFYCRWKKWLCHI